MLKNQIPSLGKDYNGAATSKGCQRREYQNYLWVGYHWRKGKEDVQEKRG
jgi:hypothetical protein